MITGITKFNFGNMSKWSKPNEAELEARRKMRASPLKPASPKRSSPLKPASPKRSSPVKASPKRSSPVKASPHRLTNLKIRAYAAYQNAYKKAINKTRTKTWKNQAMNTAKAFRAAGLGYVNANKWVSAVAHSYANHEARAARSRVYGVNTGRYQAHPGSFNYIHTNHPLYNSLNKLRRRLTA